MKKLIKPALILLPNLLDPKEDYHYFLPGKIEEIVNSLDGLIAESEKEARKYLYRFFDREKAFSFPIKLLNEHTEDKDIASLLDFFKKNQRWGLISDCGLPCIADPGSKLVNLANLKNVYVEAVSGPSSIVFALLLSGFSSQEFSFHGYLPRKFDELKLVIKTIEKNAKVTQLWIEAPYRTDRMINFLTNTLKPNTKLCVAIDLSMPTQKVINKSIDKWKKHPITIGKRPAIFLIKSN